MEISVEIIYWSWGICLGVTLTSAKLHLGVRPAPTLIGVTPDLDQADIHRPPRDSNTLVTCAMFLTLKPLT